jgi:hypothetical protein
MSTEADIAQLMSRAQMLCSQGGIQMWRTFVPAKHLCPSDASALPDGSYFLGFGAEEWQAKECLHHQVRVVCGWKRVADRYEK